MAISTTKIQSVEINPYEVTLLVSFDGYLTVDDELTKVTNYQFNNNMYARYSEMQQLNEDGYADSILLWVEKFQDNSSFTLTISNLSDCYGNDVVDSYGFSPSSISYAHISNYNGLIRTWHDSNFIQADSERVYLATEGGIDVFNKNTPSHLTRWGHIFDSYGVDSMCVTNYGSDYTFTDVAVPSLFSQDPSPNSFWDNIGPITIGVLDIDTAVRITDLIIYVDDAIAFNGPTGGFSNNFYGNILVGYRNLLAILYPPSFYATGKEVSVQVIATDLSGNRLNTTYYFIIGAGGFGVGSFGLFSFGS